MPFTCHDCGRPFLDEPSHFANVEVGSSTTVMNVGGQVGTAATRHYQPHPICKKCNSDREATIVNVVLLVAACLSGAPAALCAIGIATRLGSQLEIPILLWVLFVVFAAV